MSEITIKERLARMEERQESLYKMVEQSLSSYGDLANRVSSLEALKHKALGMIAVIGLGTTMIWEWVKESFNGKG